MYAPWDLSSFARVGSTKVILPVTFLALSRGTIAPHWLQCIVPELPFPPLVLPRLVRFFGISKLKLSLYPFKSCDVNAVLNSTGYIIENT
jgi:hypothetical protein